MISIAPKKFTFGYDVLSRRNSAKAFNRAYTFYLYPFITQDASLEAAVAGNLDDRGMQYMHCASHPEITKMMEQLFVEMKRKYSNIDTLIDDFLDS